MGGAKYEYATGSSVHASAQQTFRFPVTDEFYSTFSGATNFGLKEQTGIQYEVGIKHNFNNKIVAHVTPYYMEFDNEIFLNPQNFSNSNIDKTRRLGVEVGQEANLLKFVDIDFLDKLKLLTSYNYQNPKIIDGAYKDSVVPFAPNHQSSAGISTTFLKYYNFSFSGHYVGSRFKISDFGNASNRMKPYYTLDTKIAYERTNWEVYAAIDNLTDYRYIGTTIYTGSNYHYPSPGKMYTFGANVKF
jgi:iron complex outermembrane receptor protein